jgi:hypothetical protein
MKYKFFKLTSVCLMTLVFGMKLASAAPILLTFDWTGQCDDCQGIGGAVDVPGTNLNDDFTQSVSGLLKVNYYPENDPGNNSQFIFVSFVYNGSSIVHKVGSREDNYPAIGWNFSVVDETVLFNGRISIPMDTYHYYGDFSDGNVGDVSIVETGRYGYITERVDAVNYNFEVRDGKYGLYVTYETTSDYVCTKYCYGTRDEGASAGFVMRGVLPSPFAKPNSIPEPSTIAIFALGMLGLSLRRKKRT